MACTHIAHPTELLNNKLDMIISIAAHHINPIMNLFYISLHFIFVFVYRFQYMINAMRFEKCDGGTGMIKDKRKIILFIIYFRVYVVHNNFEFVILFHAIHLCDILEMNFNISFSFKCSL